MRVAAPMPRSAWIRMSSRSSSEAASSLRLVKISTMPRPMAEEERDRPEVSRESQLASARARGSGSRRPPTARLGRFWRRGRGQKREPASLRLRRRRRGRGRLRLRFGHSRAGSAVSSTARPLRNRGLGGDRLERFRRRDFRRPGLRRAPCLVRTSGAAVRPWVSPRPFRSPGSSSRQFSVAVVRHHPGVRVARTLKL